MGGFNINLPGLNFNLTPEAIDAARAAQGLPPLNPPPVAAPPPSIPAPMPPVASPAGDPTIVQSPVQAFAGRPEPMAERPSIGQGVGSFLLNERFGQNIPVEPRVPITAPPPDVAPAVVPPPAAAPAPAPVSAPSASATALRNRLNNSSLNRFLGSNRSAPSERFEPIQADLPIQPVPQPPPVVAPPPPPIVEPPPPIIDSEGIPAVITPPPVIAPPPPPPPPVVELAPAPVVAPPPPPPPPVITPPPPQPRDSLGDLVLSAPSERFEPIQADLPVQPAPQPPPVVEPAPPPASAVAMRDRLADSTFNEFLGLDGGRPMSSETRWGQPVPAQRPRATPTPPEPTPPAVDEGIASLTRDAISATQYPGLEGFDPANPLNPVATPAPAPAPAPTPAASTVPLTGGPPVGYQGGGGEYNPQNGYTDEDRIAEDAFYAEQRRAQREQEFADREAAQPAPPPPVIDSPPVEDDYVEIPPPSGGDDLGPGTSPGGGPETPPPPVYDPEAPTGGGQDGGDVVVTVPDAGDDLYTPGPVVGREEEPPEDTGPAGAVISRDGADTVVQLPDESVPDGSIVEPVLPEVPEIPQRQQDLAESVLKMAVGLSDYPEDLRFDVNGDGEINVLDALQILKGDFSEDLYGYEIGAAPEPAPAPGPEPAPPIEVEPEQPLPRYRYTPYVPQQFNYILPDVARSFAPFGGMGSFQPRPFTGGVSDSELDVGYGDVTAPELSLPPATYQPIPSFQVAQPEYVQIQGPSAPAYDPFATPIRPEFAPLPSYERTAYAPRTQKMIDQILSEEEIANPFMNPYLRSGVFGGR